MILFAEKFPSNASSGGNGQGRLRPYLSDDDNVHTLQLISWIIAGLFSLLACLISYQTIRGHLKNFSSPNVQRKVVGILWIVPIFAIDSWLSLRFINASVYLDMFRDCYESYVIHLFLSLMIAYLCRGEEYVLLNSLSPTSVAVDQSSPEKGGESSTTHQNAQGQRIISHMFPFKYCMDPWALDRNFLKKCKRGTLQFCILKPLLTIIAAICEYNEMYDQGVFNWNKGYVYVTMVENMSITYAAYVLVLFYVAFKEELAPYNPVPKFLCIKAVLFLSFWQSVMFAIASKVHLIHEVGRFTTDNVQTGLNNLALCFEMFLIAIAHKWAFPYTDYQKGGQSKNQLRSTLLGDNFAFTDTLRDFNDSGLSSSLVFDTGFKPGKATVKYKHFPPAPPVLEMLPEEDDGHPGRA